MTRQIHHIGRAIHFLFVGLELSLLVMMFLYLSAAAIIGVGLVAMVLVHGLFSKAYSTFALWAFRADLKQKGYEQITGAQAGTLWAEHGRILNRVAPHDEAAVFPGYPEDPVRGLSYQAELLRQIDPKFEAFYQLVKKEVNIYEEWKSTGVKDRRDE